MFSPDTASGDERHPLAAARAVVFSPIGGQGLVEQAVRRLGEAIGLGVLEVGERLPSEAELAERFGIAPMTLRQALAILREAGYVETRRGRGGGTFVQRALPPSPAKAASARLASLTVEDLRDLTDFRQLVAGASASLAAERASPAEIGELRSLVEKMAAPPPYSRFRRADSRFHLTVASAARSTRLTAAEAQLQAEVSDLMALIPHPPEALRVSNQQHRGILEAIARREPEAARELMESHVSGTGDFLVGLRLGKVRHATAPKAPAVLASQNAAEGRSRDRSAGEAGVSTHQPKEAPR
jgi:DNA-binding FadR family transcriptional regulator